MKNLIFITVRMDLSLKKKFETFFRQRGMSFDSALDFLIRDYLLKYQTRLSEERMEEFKLSPREKEVVRLLFKGRQTKEIAGDMFVSIYTVKQHIRHVYQKCKVENRVELMNVLRLL